jgi:hypothetical protein
MASRAWPHEPTTSTFALVTALRSLTAVVIVADMAQRSVTCTEPQTTRRPFAADTIDAMTTNVAPSRPQQWRRYGACPLAASLAIVTFCRSARCCGNTR